MILMDSQICSRSGGCGFSAVTLLLNLGILLPMLAFIVAIDCFKASKKLILFSSSPPSASSLINHFDMSLTCSEIFKSWSAAIGTNSHPSNSRS